MSHAVTLDGILVTNDPVMEAGVLTLRDYFAGQALCGLMALPITGGETPIEMFARASYEMADAMLKERAK